MSREWQEMTDEKYQQHLEEIAKDYDEMEYKKEPWWWHVDQVDEWLKEKMGWT